MNEERRDDLLVRVAKAIEDEHYKQLNKKLSEHNLKPKEFEEFFLALRAEGDRALAIVSYAYIDERLKDLFGSALNGKIAGGLKSLLDGMGPLSSSGARIQVAGALYWLRPDTYHNLGLLRKIRNDFAHDPAANDFSHRRIAGLITSMTPLEEPILKVLSDSEATVRKLAVRELFFIRAAITCQSMISEIAAFPVAQRMGLPGGAAFGRGYDNLPDDYKELNRSAAKIVLAIIDQ